MLRLGDGTEPFRVAACAAILCLASCGALPPTPAPSRPVPESATLGSEPSADYARAREEERRGIGIPPAQPGPRTVDRLPGALRASRPAPGTGPTVAPWSGAPANALSRLSALPASPLANPPGGFALGRP